MGNVICTRAKYHGLPDLDSIQNTLAAANFANEREAFAEIRAIRGRNGGVALFQQNALNQNARQWSGGRGQNEGDYG